jgi:uncharacterized protein YdhG (YjbR/CyaY superfamily)
MSEVENYISQFEPEVQHRLKEIRQLFFDDYPNVEERISYNMPSYRIGKEQLYFAAYKNHIGFYPVYGLLDLEDELVNYRAKGTKDTLHFLHQKALPIDLIQKILEKKFSISDV